MHQLHHRYFDCNYGSNETPWDKIFGSFHDGTGAGNEYIKECRRRMFEKKNAV
jgi:lathosterol oxidase